MALQSLARSSLRNRCDKNTFEEVHLLVEAGKSGKRMTEDMNRLLKVEHQDEAFKTLEAMRQQGVPLSANTVQSLLQGCSKVNDIPGGRRLQTFMVQGGLGSDAFLGSYLIRLFAAGGHLSEANKAFHTVAKPNVYAWSAVVSANAKLGRGENALELYYNMELLNVNSDTYVYIAALRACTVTASLMQGRIVHAQIIEAGLKSDIVIGSTLIDMYSKCGSLEEASKVFDELLNRDVVVWGAMIGGYAQHGCGLPALGLYNKMIDEGITPDKSTISSTLKACSRVGALEQGRLVHGIVIDNKLDSEVIGNSLVDMYARCESLEEARDVFDALPKRTVVSWGTMIAGYAGHGHGSLALYCFEKMQEEGIKVDKIILLSTIKACASIGAIEQGMLIHCQVIESGLESDVELGSALVNMYAKCGLLEDARKIFDGLHNQTVVSWGSMIEGYAQKNDGLMALDLVDQMQHEGLKPDKVVFLSILKACGSIGAIKQGKLAHDQIIKSGLESDLSIGGALIDMYVKCGSLVEAQAVFDKLESPDVVSWCTIITGYAKSGNIELVEKCFKNMQKLGVKPNAVLFTNILAACSHKGLLDDGVLYFKSMKEDHGIIADVNHYNCMVDLLGRAGYLNEAEFLLLNMQADMTAWTSLLTACRTYGNMEIGRRCFDEIVQLHPEDASAYILMSNIYTDAQMLEDAGEIEDLRKSAYAWKKPGRAWIEVDNKVHEFIVGDKSHEQSDEIYAMIKKLSKRMKEEGYVPQLDKVMSGGNKEDALCGHCEKLAVAFGLVNTPPNTTIRVRKNIRVCPDCHTATKIISKIEEREIIIRDGYRIHHFKSGLCSCGDYV